MIVIKTKEIILKAAKELFETYGYKKTSMDEIAKKSNVTKKTVYSYFKDKETLINTIIDNEFQRLKKEVDKISEKDNDIISFVKQTSSYLLKYKNKSKLLKTLMEENNNIVSIPSKIDEVIIGYIKDKLLILKREKPNLVFDTNLTAFIIYKIYIAIMFEWQEEINEKEVTDNIVKILESGLLS